jgi:hypothetical protein
MGIYADGHTVIHRWWETKDPSQFMEVLEFESKRRKDCAELMEELV